MITKCAMATIVTGLLSSLCPIPGWAACDNCASFGQAANWGAVTASALTEASGIAASQRTPGVLWTHNDGSRQRIYAVSTNGSYLAGFSLNTIVEDVEDIAVGPGPVPGVSYLYVGDTGASGYINLERWEIRVLRVPEPVVEQSWASNPVTADFDGVETITLRYPDGGHDAEGLMIDSQTGDVFVITKHPASARVYSANLTSASNGSIVPLQFVWQLNFAAVSGADLSADGTRILVRREDFAMTWARCAGESVGDALGRSGLAVPVSSQELNGEGIGMLPDGSGYVTISEGSGPSIFFFESQCPVAPRFTAQLTSITAMVGANVTFKGAAVGYPPPRYSWKFNGNPIAGQTLNTLALSSVGTGQAGTYELTASNSLGTVASSATLTVNAKPDLRITEVLSNPAPSPGVPTQDWWELTSFESQPVDLSGWKFNDNAGGLADPFVVGAGLVITPGESIVFVDSLDAAQFRAWWGAANLPAGLKIITYSGPGLGFGAGGDGIRLWASTATSDANTVASADFGAAADGITFNYDPATAQFGVPSQVGVNGVFQAASSPDIGSPGRIYGPVAQPRLRVTRSADRVRIEFDGIAGTTYELQARGDLASGQWLPTGESVRITANAPVTFEVPSNAGRVFYRVAAHR